MVYDAANVGLDYWIILMVPAGPCFMGLIYYFRRNQRWAATFAVVWSIGWIALGGVGAYNVNFQRLRCAQWVRSGEYRVVEGVVSDFHPIPATGHDSERFTVDGVRFEYSDNDLSKGGFNNAASLGGPIKTGLRVKIAYNQGRILRLWVPD